MALLLALVLAGAGGTTSFPLLSTGQGLRGCALGETGTSLAQDASAVFWNPAGLAGVQNYDFAVGHQQWFGGLADEVGHAALKLGPGSLGLGLVYSGDYGFEAWNHRNEFEGGFNTWAATVSAGYGLVLARTYRVGACLTGLAEDLRDATGTGAALDLGVQTTLGDWLGLGAAVRHVGVATYGSRSENLPAEGALGADYRFGRFAAAADVVFPFSNLPNARVGIEYSPVREAALRMGWRSGPYDIATLGPMSGLTAGLGLTLGRFGVDYAFVPYGKLGATHRIGLRATVERPRTPEFGSLDIVLVDARAGFPVAAFVTVAGLLDTSAITERLKLGPLRPGRLVVKAVASGYVPRTEQLDLVAGRDRTVTLKLEKVKFGDVAGGIYDAGTKRPVGGRIVYRGVVYGDEVVNPAPGTFRLRNLPAGDYRVGISGPSEDYIPQSCTLTVAGGATLERDFFLVKKKQTIVLEGINFETGKAEILAQSGPVLDRAGQILKQTADVRVELAGHTDAREINTKEFPDNWALSQARAEAVRKYLIDKWGIAPDRLTARGYADTQPLAGNDTPEGMARNRRTEFRILE